MPELVLPEPVSPAKLIASPRQIAELRDIFFRFMRGEQMAEGQKEQ